MIHPSNAELRALDLAHVWHPCTQMKDHEATMPLVPLRRGQGVWLEDYEGHRYLDAISSWWVNLWGHANPDINAAVREQLERLPHVMFAGFTHEPAARLAAELTKLAPPGLNRCFFADSGSASIEVAVKMSFHFWQNTGQPRKTRFVTLTNSYHGETLGALAVGSVELYKAIYRPLLMDVITVASPDAFLAEPGETPADVARRRAAELESVLAAQADEIAAVILEPLVQCAGNMRMYDPLYLKRVREACDRHGIHLIADEIAVGFGRTGTLFAHEQAGIRPDFLCLSKGLTGGFLPLSVVLSTDRIYDAFYDDDATRGFLHSHSYTGNPLACRAALAVLDIFADDDVITTNRDKATRFDAIAAPLAGDPRVAWFRRTGMIWAFDVPTAPRGFARRFSTSALASGALLVPLGRTVYFMPPYVVDDEEFAMIVGAAQTALDATFTG